MKPSIGVTLAVILGTGVLCDSMRYAWAQEASPERIALEILEPDEREGIVQDWPVALGLVFPEGELSSVPGGRIVDDQGRPVPFEAEATGWWSPERESVKWLLLRFVASTDRGYFYESGKWGPEPQGVPLAVSDGDRIHVSTGPL